MNRGTCVHFTGLPMREGQAPCCAAGVNYREAFGQSPGVYFRLPCVKFHERPAHGCGTYIRADEATVEVPLDRGRHKPFQCALYEEPTPEAVQQLRRERDARQANFMRAVVYVADWRTTRAPYTDRSDVLACPVCHGRLHVSQTASNGHVAARCETEGCVAWME